MSEPVPRRVALRTVATVSIPLLAGCQSLLGGGGESAPERTGCDREITPHPNPTPTENLSPKPYPALPEQFDRSTVAEFVASFERAYKWNEILREESDLQYVDVDGVDVDDVSAVGDGFVVRVRVTFGWGSGENDEGGADLEADGGAKVSYFVADGYLERVESDDWEYADPTTTEGTVLRCIPKTTE